MTKLPLGPTTHLQYFSLGMSIFTTIRELISTFPYLGGTDLVLLFIVVVVVVVVVV